MSKVGKVVALSSVCLFAASFGCARITARSLEPFSWEPEGIPFYLPKPYLIVAKNIRYIPTPTVGLTETIPIPNSFDPAGNEVSLIGTVGQTRSIQLKRTITSTSPQQPQGPDKSADDDTSGENSETEQQSAKDESSEEKEPGTGTGGGEGSGTAVTTATTGGGSGHGKQVLSPPQLPLAPTDYVSDGLMPHTFYTYQIVYLPDLTQKYGLTIRDGPGEFRATMNLVNGWMHTGAGPIYMRDSTTAASLFAGGMSTSNVIDSVAGLGLAGASTAAAPGLAPTVAKMLPTLLGTQLQADSEGKPILPTPKGIPNYAELYVYEPYVATVRDEVTKRPRKEMKWRLLGGFEKTAAFKRDYVGVDASQALSNGVKTRISDACMCDPDKKSDAFVNIISEFNKAEGTHVTLVGRLVAIKDAGGATLCEATIDGDLTDQQKNTLQEMLDGDCMTLAQPPD